MTRAVVIAAALAAVACGPGGAEVRETEPATKVVPPDAGVVPIVVDAAPVADPVADATPPSPPDASPEDDFLSHLPAGDDDDDDDDDGDEDDPCAKVSKAQTLRLRLNKKLRTRHGLYVMFTGSGHKILARRGAGGGLQRAGDMGFVILEFKKGKDDDEHRRMGDSWHEWQQVLGLCWRGRGDQGWHPKKIKIQVGKPRRKH